MKELTKIENELEAWWAFCNSILGILAFTFALACLSIPEYLAAIASTTAIYMIFIIGDACSPTFSPTLQLLKNKIIKSGYDEEILDFIKTEFFSQKRYIVFNVGMVSLVLTWFYTMILLGMWIWQFFAEG